MQWLQYMSFSAIGVRCAPFVPVKLAILLGFARISNVIGVSNHGTYAL